MLGFSSAEFWYCRCCVSDWHHILVTVHVHGCCVYNVCTCSCASLSGCAGLHTEVGQMVREKWRSMLASCCHGTSYVPDKRLGQLLQQWGGDDEEGVGQAEKEGGERERRLKVLGEDLTAEELKEVLQVSCVTHFHIMLRHATSCILCKALQHCNHAANYCAKPPGHRVS